MPPHSADAPAKKQSKWSPEEDALIIELRGSGMKWEDISKRLPGRSAISCRLHYQNYLERRSEWDEDRKNKLARLYERFKPEMWAKVAEEMQVPWRAAEAMHWQLGESDMARRAGVVPFSLTAATMEAPLPHHYRTSPSRGHHHSQSYGGASAPRYGRLGSGPPTPGGLYTIPGGRPAPARREAVGPYGPGPESDDAMYYTHTGPGLAPIQAGAHDQTPGTLPGVAELTTGMSAYSTPAYSMSIPSASPIHSQSNSPVPPFPGMAYPSYEPAGAKRRASPPEQAYREPRRRHYDPRYDDVGEPSVSRY